MREAEKFSVPRTFLLGFGFLGVSIIWSMYNTYVPIFLKEGYGLKSTAIGAIMTIDNVFAIVLLPFLGALSDRTRSPLGRRRPYILVGSILATAFIVTIPSASASQKLGLMMLIIVAMNLCMALFRSPVIALMPDITPSRYRSQANGIINFMGGLGSLLVFFGGKPLYNSSPSLLYLVGGLAMLVACLLVVLLVREPALDPAAAGKKSAPVRDAFRELGANMKDVFTGEKSLLAILLAILCWFIGYNAIETFFTSYAKYYLGIEESNGALILGFFSVTFMVTSILSGLLAGRFGRRRTIRVGLAVVLVVMLAAHGGGYDHAREAGRLHRPLLFLLPGGQHRLAPHRGRPHRRFRLPVPHDLCLGHVSDLHRHREPRAQGGGRPGGLSDSPRTCGSSRIRDCGSSRIRDCGSSRIRDSG
jgi:maltose/moltooligosaccharide transporter